MKNHVLKSNGISFRVILFSAMSEILKLKNMRWKMKAAGIGALFVGKIKFLK